MDAETARRAARTLSGEHRADGHVATLVAHASSPLWPLVAKICEAGGVPYPDPMKVPPMKEA